MSIAIVGWTGLVGQNLINGDWKGLLGATTLAAMQGTVQSPRVMGQTAYGLGTVSGSIPGKTIGAISEKVPTFAAPSSPFAINVERAEKEADPFARYVPSGYARGGKVGSSKAVLVKRMMDLAEKAKKEFSKHTEPLLNASDETIVKALHVANQAI